MVDVQTHVVDVGDWHGDTEAHTAARVLSQCADSVWCGILIVFLVVSIEYGRIEHNV